jgi:hypothetical protein
VSAATFVALVISFFAGLHAGNAGMYYVLEKRGDMYLHLAACALLVSVVVVMCVRGLS